MASPKKTKRVLEHVLGHLLGATNDPNDPIMILVRTLRIQSITELMILEEADLSNLTLNDSQGQPFMFPIVPSRRILALKQYVNSYPPGLVNEDHWLDLAVDQYNAFLQSPRTAWTPPVPTTPISSTPVTSTKTTPAEAFEKGSRRAVL